MTNSEQMENPYEDYETFEVVVKETVKKNYKVWAKDPESAKEYVDTYLNELDMAHGIDEYDICVDSVEECEPGTCDFTVPLRWYE